MGAEVMPSCRLFQSRIHWLFYIFLWSLWHWQKWERHELGRFYIIFRLWAVVLVHISCIVDSTVVTYNVMEHYKLISPLFLDIQTGWMLNSVSIINIAILFTHLHFCTPILAQVKYPRFLHTALVSLMNVLYFVGLISSSLCYANVPLPATTKNNT